VVKQRWHAEADATKAAAFVYRQVEQAQGSGD
jgi:hypothetical protein